jgi:hypothetical protein
MAMPFGTKLSTGKRMEAMEQGRITVHCSWPGCTSSISIYRSQHVWGVGRKNTGGGVVKNAYCPSCKGKVSSLIGREMRMNGFGRLFSMLGEKRISRICNSESLRAFLFIRHDGSCVACKTKLVFDQHPKAWQVDHIVPVATGGESSHSNLQVLCTNCHKEKTARELVSTRKYCGIPNSHRQWMTHHQKDALIVKQNVEIARLKALLARHVNDEELAG